MQRECTSVIIQKRREVLQMEIQLLDHRGKEVYSESLLEMCQNSDKEFVPSLSQRSSTTQSTLQGGSDAGIGGLFLWHHGPKYTGICGGWNAFGLCVLQGKLPA